MPAGPQPASRRAGHARSQNRWRYFSRFLATVAGLVGGATCLLASPGTIHMDAVRKQVTLVDGQGQLALRLNYDGRCIVDQVVVRGREVAAASGVHTGVCQAGRWFTTLAAMPAPSVAISRNTLTVTGICFGRPGSEVRETWKFTVRPADIGWQITRKYSAATTLADAAFPAWDFRRQSTWTGGLLDNGGVVWSKYLDTPNATYGAHAGAVTFWNRAANDCLRITPALPPGQFGTVRFSHQPDDVFTFNYAASDRELQPNHDLRRYLPDRQDLWAPFPVPAGEVRVAFTLQALAYDQAYDRGTFAGLNGGDIRELLNTVARYGVIDRQLTGGNGWRSGYICLHEPWFGQIGAALGQPDYIANYSAALDYYRDHALGPDGRVKSRWTYDAGDALPGTYDSHGFYEAQWGWLMDSQPDYVINVAEQFALTGDRPWLAGQKIACEKALQLLLRREVQNTGLVAMRTDSTKAQRGSDWIDIVWAAYENALVNAELYYALTLWADVEAALADPAQADKCRAFAARLKKSFNRPTTDGGFWNSTNQWYVYWRDKDASIHGDNLVTPVNFAAIAYGLCDDPKRQQAILARIEKEMQKENLFAWPLSFFPYQPTEGAGSNFPFPKYENGDLFLSWSEVGVRAYAAREPALALKYVKKTLARYAEDGLSFQRYLRQSQSGAGDDILAGNCMPIVGLYRDLFGLQPRPNRLYLEPHLSGELNGTKLRYPLRGQPYEIELSTTNVAVSTGAGTLSAPTPFGINATATALEFFPGTNTDWAMSVTRPTRPPLHLKIENWPADPDALRLWTESSPPGSGMTSYLVQHLRPLTRYDLKANHNLIASGETDHAGQIKFKVTRGKAVTQCFELGLAASSR